MPNIIRVLIVDDHPPFRLGVRGLLEMHNDIQIVGEAGTGKEAVTKAKHHAPEVILLDCQLPDIDGPAVAREVKELGVDSKILALSAFDDVKYIRELLDAGSVGYLLKSEAPDSIVAATRAASMGETYFSHSITSKVLKIAFERQNNTIKPTKREQEVLSCLSTGMTNALIASQLQISERTVAYHIENLLNKLGADNRTEVVVEAIRRGWLNV